MSELPAARVLIVDDDTDTVDTLVTLLEQDGHDCAAAYTGAAALRMCEGVVYDCLVLDHQLGEVNGLTVARRLDGTPQRPRLIVLLTGEPPETFDEALRDGLIDEHLQKPPHYPELLALVRRSLSTPLG